ncbi:MAG: branched-chain-amino-acid transaminase [Candidatus Nezhaarchaeota archaeon]|nr:branched-chain-amino-acid transaminase [Candidatus Nezhaarchaeota archaeon]MCX8142243.1 branched-chain-amino-acid transaminase [Candidatus Nezhaarchaeota archaeon]MDW8050784.1 branched-chain-amino-acid transaminase [Nitrososphaerota archaeon]
MEKEPLVYINGELVPKSQAKISVFDHGFLYGDGVFESVMVYNGVAFKLREHIDRLYDSAKALCLEIPMSKEELIKTVVETIRINGLRNAYVRVLVTRGVGDLGLDPRKCSKPTLIIIVDKIKLFGDDAYSRGVTAIISSVRRDRVDATTHEIKSMNYLNSILAKLEANAVGADEAIMLDERGFVAEGATDNVFMVKNGIIYTPPRSSGILPGITRARVMKLAEDLGYKVVERDITPAELLTADEVFLTGTAVSIVPVVKIAGRVIGDGKPGPITRKLIEEFKRIREDPSEGVKTF